MGGVDVGRQGHLFAAWDSPRAASLVPCPSSMTSTFPQGPSDRAYLCSAGVLGRVKTYESKVWEDPKSAIDSTNILTYLYQALAWPANQGWKNLRRVVETSFLEGTVVRSGLSLLGTVALTAAPPLCSRSKRLRFSCVRGAKLLHLRGKITLKRSAGTHAFSRDYSSDCRGKCLSTL